MSQRLSTSVTFQSLSGRVGSLEAKFPSGGNLLLEDKARLPLIDLTKDGVINWRLGNWNGDPATNAFSIGFNSTTTATFDTSGNATFSGCIDAAYLRSAGAAAPISGVGVELRWDGASGSVLSYDRSAGSFRPIVLAGSNILLDPQGGVVAISGATTFGDANFGAAYNGGLPKLSFDGGDQIVYDRAANKFYFVIGGVNVASIDASGNMRLKGTLAQSVTP